MAFVIPVGILGMNNSHKTSDYNLLDLADTKIHCIKDLRKDYFNTVDLLIQFILSQHCHKGSSFQSIGKPIAFNVR